MPSKGSIESRISVEKYRGSFYREIVGLKSAEIQKNPLDIRKGMSQIESIFR